MLAWFVLRFVRLGEASFAAKRRVAAQGLVEYALIIMLIAIVVIGIMTTLGQTLCTGWYLSLVGPGSPFEVPGASC
ncbi:MAG TPA: Flp family type IVb pilin [Herpetosiphonaceae bacterium]